MDLVQQEAEVRLDMIETEQKDRVQTGDRLFTNDKQTTIANIHRLINNCYDDESRNRLFNVIKDIWGYLADTSSLSYALSRDIIHTIFRKRNNEFQERNIEIFTRFIDERLPVSSPGLYYTWLMDALEYLRDAYRPLLLRYMVTWLTEPRFMETLPLRSETKYQFYLCKYLICYGPLDIQEIAVEFLFEKAESAEYSTFIRGDAMDVLLSNPIPQKYAERLAEVRDELAQVDENTEANRRLEAAELGIEYVPPAMRMVAGGIAGTTYSDGQNVHATPVNEAINASLLAMMKDPEVRGNTVKSVIGQIRKIFLDLTDVDYQQRDRAIWALTRFKEDPSVFTERRIKLGAVLVLVWNRICRHEEREELYERLMQELADAYNTCATGHLSRTISTLVGYYPDISQMTMDYTVQLVNCIRARIYKIIKDAPEEVQGDLMYAMTDRFCKEYAGYVEYLEEHRVAIRDELHEEFVPKYMTDEDFSSIFVADWPTNPEEPAEYIMS